MSTHDVITRILRILRAMSDHVGGVEPGTTHSAFKKELDEIEAAHNEGSQPKESDDDKDKALDARKEDQSPKPADDGKDKSQASPNMAPPAGPQVPRAGEPPARPGQSTPDQRPADQRPQDQRPQDQRPTDQKK